MKGKVVKLKRIDGILVLLLNKDKFGWLCDCTPLIIKYSNAGKSVTISAKAAKAHQLVKNSLWFEARQSLGGSCAV